MLMLALSAMLVTMLARPGTALADVLPAVSCRADGGRAGDGPPARDANEARVAALLRRALQSGDTASFAKVQALAEQWNDPECVLLDGEPELGSILRGMDLLLGGNNNWDITEAGIEKAKKQFPDSPLLPLIEAEFWYQYAFDARGNGYSNTVTSEGYALFQERLLRSQTIISQSKSISAKYPLWYWLAIGLSSLLGQPGATQMQLVTEGAQRYKTFFPLYMVRANFLQPRWGGSWKVMEEFANKSAANSADPMGEGMYAEIYWWVDRNMMPDESLFRDSKASWPKMKQGFKDLTARYQRSQWILVNFAAFACQAGDGEEFLRQRKKVADSRWNELLSPDHSLDACDRKYGFPNG